MTKVYLDPINFVCSTVYDPNKIEVETNYFDGKCKEFIEGYQFIPEGHKWTDSDGIPIKGLYIAPWKPYNELAAAQAQYERGMAELQAAYQEGVNSV